MFMKKELGHLLTSYLSNYSELDNTLEAYDAFFAKISRTLSFAGLQYLAIFHSSCSVNQLIVVRIVLV